MVRSGCTLIVNRPTETVRELVSLLVDSGATSADDAETGLVCANTQIMGGGVVFGQLPQPWTRH